MKYRDLFNRKSQTIKYYRVLKGDPTSNESAKVTKYHDEGWIKHLNFDFKMFRFSQESIPKVVEQKVRSTHSSNPRIITNTQLPMRAPGAIPT
jgi:hypothetical protein